MPKKVTPDQIPYNPAMLRWARQWGGKSLDEAAAKVHKKPEEVAGWETPNTHSPPTVRQARVLAEFYERPFLEFFLPEPPDLPSPELVPDFRMHAGEVPPRESRELQRIQEWAEALRQNALDLVEQLGDPVPQVPVPLITSMATAPDVAASNARAILEFSFETQLSKAAENADALAGYIRGLLDGIGILVFRRNDLRQFGVRGICLAETPLPVIVFHDEAPTAQAFNHHVIQDIVDLIAKAKVVVCDCSGRNPNVFYEIGIAHSLGKDVILIARSADDIPFDLQHLRYLTYLPNRQGLGELTKGVQARLKTLTGKT